MSNTTLDILCIGLLALHIAAAALALTRRSRAWLWLNAGVAALALVGVAFDWRAFLRPADWPVLALAIFEIAVLFAAARARVGSRPALIFSGAALALHLAASALAVLFVLTFKMRMF